MDNHYDFFKENLSKIEIHFKKLLLNNTQQSTKTLSAKQVAIMIEKYLD